MSVLSLTQIYFVLNQFNEKQITYSGSSMVSVSDCEVHYSPRESSWFNEHWTEILSRLCYHAVYKCTHVCAWCKAMGGSGCSARASRSVITVHCCQVSKRSNFRNSYRRRNWPAFHYLTGNYVLPFYSFIHRIPVC